MNNLLVFLAIVALLYLFDALREIFLRNDYQKLVKFAWMSFGVFAGKALAKFVMWAINW